MTDLNQLAYYRVGLRLTQARLKDGFRPGLVPQHLRLVPMNLLDVALGQIGNVHPDLVVAAMRIVDRARTILIRTQEDEGPQVDADNADHEIDALLNELLGLGRRMTAREPNERAALVLGLELAAGLEFADGEGPERANALGSAAGNLSWDNEAVIRDALELLDLSLEQLLPDIPNKGSNAALLPYDRFIHWLWFRLEAGLNALGARLNPSHVEMVVPEEDTSGSNRLEYLGLVLNMDQSTVSRNGITIVPTHQEWTLLTIFVRKRQFYTTYDDLREVAGSMDTCRRAVSSLRKVLRPLGLRIKSRRQFGYQLVEASVHLV